MSNNSGDNSGFNIDDLVKKIDAKIAEIEAEEKRQKELEEKEKNNTISKEENDTKNIQVPDAKVEEETDAKNKNDVLPESKTDEIDTKINTPEPTEKPTKTIDDFLDSMNKIKAEQENNKSLEETKEILKPVTNEKPKDIIIHEDKIPKKEIDITDDAFFDDFFDDED